MLTRPLLIALGLVATLLAIAGAILPGLPTTPFLPPLAMLCGLRESLHPR